MKEVLTFWEIKEDFERLGIRVRKTYVGKEYIVCELSDEEFKSLCDEPDIKGTWENGGWRYVDSSILGEPNIVREIRGKQLKCWEGDTDYVDFMKEIGIEVKHENLLDYMSEELGVGQMGNVCALAMDLAKYNGMKMSELFEVYQG